MDLPFLMLVLLLLGIGLIMMFSASYATAYYTDGDPLVYISRQALFGAVGVVDVGLRLGRKKTPKALDIVGLALSVCVAAYTGVLLGDAGVASPLRNMAVLPFLFGASAASPGFAAVLPVTRRYAPAAAATLTLTT